jgi:hypothetical protein
VPNETNQFPVDLDTLVDSHCIAPIPAGGGDCGASKLSKSFNIQQSGREQMRKLSAYARIESYSPIAFAICNEIKQ